MTSPLQVAIHVEPPRGQCYNSWEDDQKSKFGDWRLLVQDTTSSVSIIKGFSPWLLQFVPKFVRRGTSMLLRMMLAPIFGTRANYWYISGNLYQPGQNQ